MADEQDIVIDADGTVRFVYSDLLADVFTGEDQHTVRASHVEPHPLRGGWLADMRPSGGPVLGERCSLHLPVGDMGDDTAAALVPFATRQAALDAEREWLRRERGL
jgi:hypothetical protein